MLRGVTLHQTDVHVLQFDAVDCCSSGCVPDNPLLVPSTVCIDGMLRGVPLRRTGDHVFQFDSVDCCGSGCVPDTIHFWCPALLLKLKGGSLQRQCVAARVAW